MSDRGQLKALDDKKQRTGMPLALPVRLPAWSLRLAASGTGREKRKKTVPRMAGRRRKRFCTRRALPKQES
jgi:hypothetical protein